MTDRKMSTNELPVPVSYSHGGGTIHIERTLQKLRGVRNEYDLLRRTLAAVWADAYTYGWADGKRDADPDERDNPYD